MSETKEMWNNTPVINSNNAITFLSTYGKQFNVFLQPFYI